MSARAMSPVRSRYSNLPEPADAAPGHVPVAVGELIEDCLAFEPAHRPTPQQVAERLEPLLGALPRPRLAGIKLSMR